MHGLHHAVVGLRARDGEHAGVCGHDLLWLGAHAARHDHLAVLLEPRADRGERFRLGAVEKAAGVDNDGVGARVGLGQFVAFGAKPGDDALGIDQRLGAAERDEGNAGGGAIHRSEIEKGAAKGKEKRRETARKRKARPRGPGF